MMGKRARVLLSAVAIGCAACWLAHLARAEGAPAPALKKLVLAVPGVPPIFAALIAHVAEQQGMFQKFAGDVVVKDLESGTTAARAVISGDVDIALSPSPLIVNQ